MELQRIVWYWDSLVERLSDSEPDLCSSLRRSCRPLEAERRADGWLMLVLGCWQQADLAALSREATRSRLERALGRMLEEQLRVTVVRWPGGLAAVPPAESGAEVNPPDLLAELPPPAREEAARCESPIQRYFYAHAYRRGLRPRCQHQLLRFRVDFAFLEQRVAAEVVGWDWNRLGRGAGLPREREEQCGVENWRVRWFSGSEVLGDIDRCIGEVERLLNSSQGLMTRRFREPGAGVPRGLRSWPRYERRPPR